MFLPLLLLLLFAAYLTREAILHNRNLRRIPLRITVSGTRGKSSVVRTLASVMRAAGYTVVAKTTGSEAMIILPDGSEEPVKRRGRITIMEQKNLVRKAARVNANCLITEIMSIRPENHRIETQRLLKPHLTILTNFRADHLDVVRDSLKEISDLHANDIYPGSRVLIPEEEINDFIREEVENATAELILAKAGDPGLRRDDSGEADLPDLNCQITENLCMVAHAARLFAIPQEVIRRGIQNTHLDIGRPRIFCFDGPNGPVWFVNSFAANDPFSTLQLMERVLSLLNLENPVVSGLICLRSDRGERSRQWLDWLAGEGKGAFSQIYTLGTHARLFARVLPDCQAIAGYQLPVAGCQSEGGPWVRPYWSLVTGHWSLFQSSRVTRHVSHIIHQSPPNTIIFGLANIVGQGREFVDYWSMAGTEIMMEEAR